MESLWKLGSDSTRSRSNRAALCLELPVCTHTQVMASIVEADEGKYAQLPIDCPALPNPCDQSNTRPLCLVCGWNVRAVRYMVPL